MLREGKGREGRKAGSQVLGSMCRACTGCERAEAEAGRCANVACEIFFERTAVATAVEEAKTAFARLSLEW